MLDLLSAKLSAAIAISLAPAWDLFSGSSACTRQDNFPGNAGKFTGGTKTAKMAEPQGNRAATVGLMPTVTKVQLIICRSKARLEENNNHTKWEAAWAKRTK